MKNNWKETFRNDYTTKGYGDYRLWNESGNNVQKVEDFITNLLAEQKKGLLEEVSGWIAEGCAETDTMVDLAKFLRKKLNHHD